MDERELVDHVSKAVSSTETAPKQKHVRACILWTWENKHSSASGSLWNALKLQNVQADEIQSFKTLVTVHKVLRDGHPNTLLQGYRELPFLESLSTYSMRSQRGYSQLIRAYVTFLKTKLNFHQARPEFRGNMSYEDYLALKKSSDPNEGFEVVATLMNLQDDVLGFAAKVFKSFVSSQNNECKISALVPLVEESYGIFQFITSMLKAMHAATSDLAAFEVLRDRYAQQYSALYHLYQDCLGLRYLTSLISVPKLDPDPPLLYDPNRAIQKLSARPVPSLPSEPSALDEQMNALLNENEALKQQNQLLISELKKYQTQYQADQTTIANMTRHIQSLEMEMSTIRQLLSEEQHRNAELSNQSQSGKAETTALQTKLKKLTDMYTTMRNEHLELLKQKQQFAQGRTQLANAKQAFEKLQRDKEAEVNSLKREIEQQKVQQAETEKHAAEEIEQLRRQVQEEAAKVQTLGASKGEEVQSLIREYTAEKAQLEEMRQQKIRELEEARAALERLREEKSTQIEAKDEEVAVLQAGLDESLLTLQELQEDSKRREKELMDQLEALRGDQMKEMEAVLDEILENSYRKIEDAVFELENPLHVGTQSATAEYALAQAEKFASNTNDFAAAFQNLLKGGSQTKVMNSANEVAHIVEQLLASAKGASKLSSDDSVSEAIIDSARTSAMSAMAFLAGVKSTSLSSIPVASRPDKVSELNGAVQASIHGMVKNMEGLIVKEVSETDPTADIGDAVERQMLEAARAIEAAAARLMELMNAPKSADVSPSQLNVNQALLSSAMAITSAIGQLMRAATLSQQEIVAKGRGTANASEFYKKNNRWTEGLVSAARAVAIATTNLVETADGITKGTHTIEEMVVAAQEVSASTAQLVAASRVKADKGSKTQENLEKASKAVTEATKHLVKAAKESAQKRAQEESQYDFSRSSIGQLKRMEMEQQVKILTLEKDLTTARQVLADMRKHNYHHEEGEESSDDETPAKPGASAAQKPTPAAIAAAYPPVPELQPQPQQQPQLQPRPPPKPQPQPQPQPQSHFQQPPETSHPPQPQPPVAAPRRSMVIPEQDRPVIPEKPQATPKPQIPAKPMVPPKPQNH